MKRRILSIAAGLFATAAALCAQSFEEQIKMMDALSMEPPQIQTEFDARYKVENLDYGMTIGVEQTPGGRIWNCFVGGGDNEAAYFVITWRDRKSVV